MSRHKVGHQKMTKRRRGRYSRKLVLIFLAHLGGLVFLFLQKPEVQDIILKLLVHPKS